MRPTWAAFWQVYPDYTYYPDSSAVKADIGGRVESGGYANTCAIRMSAGLNGCGVTVPRNRSGLVTVKGGDGKRYALRVAEMRKWLPTVLGKADFDLKKGAGGAFDKGVLAGKYGIIAFDIQFTDATGHLDAWMGKEFSNEKKCADYWQRASRITLWQLR